MEIKGYTLHGDYYLADKVIPNKNWKEAIKMKEEIALPNGKTVIAHTLSKAELKTLTAEQRKIDDNNRVWYWTSSPLGDSGAWYVEYDGDFYDDYINGGRDDGGARLGFKNPF